MIRLFAQQGNHSAALVVDIPTSRHSLPAGIAEALASRALVLASASRLTEASGLAEEVRGLSLAIEPTVLIAAVDAIVAVKSGSPAASGLVATLAEAAMTRGGADLLVTAYRSTPELLGLLLSNPEYRQALERVVTHARDEDLAATVGHPCTHENPISRLSPREREVFEHLQHGLTNRQIAAALFIAESTVKVHVHRIFDKTGIRSRTAIAFRALLERQGQATSAIGDTLSAEDS
jgi:DNA-binding NarL/FixJ family response regulator